MSYPIIGFGNIGQALTKASAHNGIEASIATTCDPQSLGPGRSGDRTPIIPKTLAKAVKANTVFLVVRLNSHADVAKVLPSWKGRTSIDVTA